MLNNLLDDLLPDDRDCLLACGRLGDFAEGEVVTRQGATESCLFVVESGELTIVRRVPGDDEEVLDVALPGTLVGELAVLDRMPRSASLLARSPTRLRVIDLGAFESLTLESGERGLRILKAVALSLHHRLAARRRGIAAGGHAVAGALRACHSVESISGWSASPPSCEEWLSALPACASLAGAETTELATRVDLAIAGRGTAFTFSRDGQPSATLLVRGAVSPFMPVGEGAFMPLPVVSPGEFISHAEVLERDHEESYWYARSQALVARVPASCFAGDAGWGAKLLYALCRDLALKMRSTTNLAMHLGMTWDSDEAIPGVHPASG